MPTEKEKMVAGEPYDANDPQLWADRVAVRRLLHRFNAQLDYNDAHARGLLLAELLAPGTFPTEDPPFLEPPFFCDYGYNITLGANFYCNFNCIFLDCAPITVGDRVVLGPSVQLYTVNHEIDPVARNGTRGPETAKAIVIEDDVWIGGGAIVMPGVRVGRGAVVGAGAVVTRDVEPFTVVVGNPAAVIKRLPRPEGGGASDE